jgi:hypothetical protein
MFINSSKKRSANTGTSYMGGLVAFSSGSGSNAAINHKNRLPAVYNAVEQISNDIVKKYVFR